MSKRTTEKRDDGMYRVIDSTKPLNLVITPEHLKKSLATKSGGCKDPSQCVIAQAIDEAIPGGFDAIEVGSRITKITCEATKTIVRYSTPAKLKRALQAFDLTGKWNLPAGIYALHAIAGTKQAIGGRPNRWDKKKKQEHPKVPDRFRGRALPTRRISKCPIKGSKPVVVNG